MHRTATVREPSLNLGIGERVVDLTVQPLDDRGRRVSRRAKAIPNVGLEAWYEPSLSGSLPLMMPGGSNHRCRDFYTWELRRGQPIQERS